MDQLLQWEAAEIIRNLEYVDRPSRELLRAQLYVTAQSNSKRKLDPAKDVYMLPWDKKVSEEWNEKKDKALTEAARKMEELLNSGFLDQNNKEMKYSDFLEKKNKSQ